MFNNFLITIQAQSMFRMDSNILKKGLRKAFFQFSKGILTFLKRKNYLNFTIYFFFFFAKCIARVAEIHKNER